MSSVAYECQHDGCTCLVEQEGGYCSDHCREHGEDPGHEGGHACGCGHIDCESS